MFVKLKLSANYFLLFVSFLIWEGCSAFHIHIIPKNQITNRSQNGQMIGNNENANNEEFKPMESIANMLINDIFGPLPEKREDNNQPGNFNLFQNRKKNSKFKPIRRKEIFGTNDNGVSTVVVKEFIDNGNEVPLFKPNNAPFNNIPNFPDPFGLFDFEQNNKMDNKFPIGFQNPMTMPMIFIKPKRNLKGYESPNKKTPVDLIKNMDRMFDSFFDDIFNKENKNQVDPLVINNNTLKTTLFEAPYHQKIVDLNVIPSLQRFEKPNSIEKLNTNMPFEIMNPSIFKNIEQKIALNDLEVEKNLNKLDEKINVKQPKIQDELTVEKQKYITNSLPEIDDKNVDNLKHKVDQQTKPNKDESDKSSDSKSKSDSNSSESLINKITLNENISNILKGSSIAKLVKYSFYFGIALFIFMLALILFKFCLATKENDKPIKTRHSINEIEDELNNMRGREKLF